MDKHDHQSNSFNTTTSGNPVRFASHSTVFKSYFVQFEQRRSGYRVEYTNDSAVGQARPFAAM
jgi:hypothetical protein